MSDTGIVLALVVSGTQALRMVELSIHNPRDKEECLVYIAAPGIKILR